MRKQTKTIVTIGAIIIVGIILFSFYPGENNEIEIIIHNEIGLANPASGYCSALGYESRTDEVEGGQLGICIFPDKTECSSWSFYRGECGQEWSYCELKGYDLKLNQPTGAIKGVICVNKNTGEELGTVYDLVNAEWINQNK